MGSSVFQGVVTWSKDSILNGVYPVELSQVWKQKGVTLLISSRNIDSAFSMYKTLCLLF